MTATVCCTLVYNTTEYLQRRRLYILSSIFSNCRPSLFPDYCNYCTVCSLCYLHNLSVFNALPDSFKRSIQIKQLCPTVCPSHVKQLNVSSKFLHRLWYAWN